jgi:FkbM family methyltransferase
VPDEWLDTYDGDLKILCNLGSFIEWNVYFRGYYDPNLSMALKHLAQQGMVIADVGANVGAYTLLLAKQAGTDGRVLAFEPNPEVYRRLVLNIQANGFQDRVSLSRLALSQAAGIATLHVPRKAFHHRGIASLHVYSKELTDEVEVEVGTLDEQAIRLGAYKLDLIKVDTEGNDSSVLQGAMDTISKHMPVIIFEANRVAHQRAMADLKSTHQAIKSLGYSFHTVGALGQLRRLGNRDRFPDTNIVCLPARQ